MRLFLRVFANCENAEVAVGIAERLALALSGLSPQQRSSPRAYWKLPHLFEFTYNLFPAAEASFHEVVSLSSGEWHHSSCATERSSVWNRSCDRVFLISEVSWAELQLFEARP